MRVQVLVAFLLACLVGIAIPSRIPSMSSRQYQVGIASASALVDSSRSQVADLGHSTGTDVGTLAYRASLLASLMTTSPLKDRIAGRAGIAPSNLIATGPATVASSNSPAPAVSGASIGSSSPKASTLNASVPTLAAGQIPVIQVNTQGPTPAIAASLANAAFAALQAEINSVARTDNVPLLQRVVIRPLGPAAATLAIRGPGLLYGFAGAILAFILACSAILGVSSLRVALRDEAAREHGLPDPEDTPREAWVDDTPREAWVDDTPREAWADSAPAISDLVASTLSSAEGNPAAGEGVRDPQRVDEPAPARKARTMYFSRSSRDSSG